MLPPAVRARTRMPRAFSASRSSACMAFSRRLQSRREKSRSPVNAGGGVDLYVDGNFFCTRLPDIDGEGGIHHGVFCKVLDAGCVDLMVETADELYRRFILAACDEIGEHFRVVPEVVADDGEACLFFL